MVSLFHSFTLDGAQVRALQRASAWRDVPIDDLLSTPVNRNVALKEATTEARSLSDRVDMHPTHPFAVMLALRSPG